MVSISVFASLFVIPVGITSSVVGLKSCIITAGIKKYKLLIKRKKKKHDKILLVAKTKLNSIVILVSKYLTDLDASHDDVFSINNVWKECNDMKEETKSLKILGYL